MSLLCPFELLNGPLQIAPQGASHSRQSWSCLLGHQMVPAHGQALLSRAGGLSPAHVKAATHITRLRVCCRQSLFTWWLSLARCRVSPAHRLLSPELYPCGDTPCASAHTCYFILSITEMLYFKARKRLSFPPCRMYHKVNGFPRWL